MKPLFVARTFAGRCAALVFLAALACSSALAQANTTLTSVSLPMSAKSPWREHARADFDRSGHAPVGRRKITVPYDYALRAVEASAAAARVQGDDPIHSVSNSTFR